LADLEAGRAAPREQNHALACPAPKIRKEDGRIDWTLPAIALHNRVRAYNPNPICHTVENSTGRILRLHRTRPEEGTILRPGLLRVGPDRIARVGAGKGCLCLEEVQWEGKPRLSATDFINGLRGTETLEFN
jgi:methionyl-tRNA formyltransferase